MIGTPKRDDYEERDNFKLARDIAWVIRTLWGAAAVVILAAVWVAALAADVKSNKEELRKRETAVAAVPAITAALQRIENKLDSADTRQRAIKSQLDKVETDVENLKVKDNGT